MTNWLNNDESSSDDDEPTTELRPVPEKKSMNWLEQPGTPETPTEDSEEDTTPVSGPPETPAAPVVWTQQPSPTTVSEAKKSAKKAKTPKASKEPKVARATKAERAPKPQKSPAGPRQRPGWVKPVLVIVGVVVGGAAIAGAGMVGAQMLGTNAQEAVPENPQTPVAQTSSEVEPVEETTDRWSAQDEARAENEAVGVAGQCSAEGDEVEVTPSSRTLRGAVVTYQTEYWAGNADGLKSTLTKDSAMRKNDWDKVFAEAPDNAEWCITMQPVKGRHVDVDLQLVTADDAVTYPQRVTGEKNESGQWQIKEITQRGES